MNISKVLNNDVIFIVRDYYKDDLLKVLQLEPSLYNIRIITISDLKEKLLFAYDERAIFHLVSNKGMTYDYAVDVINSIYLIYFDIDNPLYLFYKNIYDELYEEGLFSKDNLFLDSLAKKKIYFYNFEYFSDIEKPLLDILSSKFNTEYINDDNVDGDIKVFSFNNINDEVEFVARSIVEKTNSGININNILIAGINDDYISTIKRVFSLYGIPINLDSKTKLYNISSVRDLVNNLESYSSYINKIDDIEIKNKCIDIFNKYYFVKDKTLLKDILSSEFKKVSLKSKRYQNAVNVSLLKGSIIDDDMHIFLVGCSSEYIPHVHKDEDLVRDAIKPTYLNKTWEKNHNEVLFWEKILKGTKNLTVSYSKNNLSKELEASSILNGYNIEELSYVPSNFSDESNLYNLGLMLDRYIKYGEIGDNVYDLVATYKNHKYMSYDNQFTGIDPKLIKDYLGSKIYLSYSKLDLFYKCPFYYYVENILKIGTYEDRFETYLGNLVHHILSKIYDDGFDLDKEKVFFISNNEFDFSGSDKLFVEKTCEFLVEVIEVIKKHHASSLFNEVDAEKKITIERDVNDFTVVFTGIIDKIIKYRNFIGVIDYKTYIPSLDLSLVPEGINLQLPIYAFLAKEIYPDSTIAGIYLQNVSRVLHIDDDKSYSEQVLDSLKLAGYTVFDEKVISSLDFTYQSSDFIRGMKTTSKGFAHYTKLLSSEMFEKLITVSEGKIDEAVNSIINGDFEIKVKRSGNTNLSEIFTSYQDLTYMTDRNNVYLKPDSDLNYLKEDTNEIY